MKSILSLTSILVIFSTFVLSEYTPLLSSSDIERINSIQKQWVAKENRFTRMSLEDAKKMFEATPLRPEFNSFPDLKFKRSRFETEDHLRQTPHPHKFRRFCPMASLCSPNRQPRFMQRKLCLFSDSSSQRAFMYNEHSFIPRYELITSILGLQRG